MEYKVHVDAGKEDCYWQYVHPGATLYVSYQVLKGGDGSIGMAVRNPKVTTGISLCRRVCTRVQNCRCRNGGCGFKYGADGIYVISVSCIPQTFFFFKRWRWSTPMPGRPVLRTRRTRPRAATTVSA